MPVVGVKRERHAEKAVAHDHSPTAESSAEGASTTNFRLVSACIRCRHRKNRCDQKLPKCTNCDKAKTRCVGFDPISKREIPRSYVYYLETRVKHLEELVAANGLQCPPPNQDFAIDESIKPGINVPFPVQDEETQSSPKDAPSADSQPAIDPALKGPDEANNLQKLVNNIGMVSVQGVSGSGPLRATSGISFARVVSAAVKRSVNKAHAPTDDDAEKKPDASTAEAAGRGTATQDSFFGLHTKPTIEPAPFPERRLGLRLTELYFEHANPQIPVLHRGEFMSLFERVYATEASDRTPRELYMLNIVFAIGSGIILDSSDVEQASQATATSGDDSNSPRKKRRRRAKWQHQPEEYHSAAIFHLDSFLSSAPITDAVEGGFEELQAVLLLASLALLRPVAPGLWYIVGVAVRLAVDLGLHSEDKDDSLSAALQGKTDDVFSAQIGRGQWRKDLRRRLWWCVFNFDRLVSSCVGRPVSISEAVITTAFPSRLDDGLITPSGLLPEPQIEDVPSYKLISWHYLRLRLLQSEILQVLQHQQADQVRQMSSQDGSDHFSAVKTGSPFLQHFRSFREWRVDIDLRLEEWNSTAPNPAQTGVAFNPLFFELNYWQAIIMLYRQSLSVPEPLAGELSPAATEDVLTPGALHMEQEEDQEMVFLKVAQAGQTVLKIYRQLHRLKLVSYTFLATHHLFMSGISFLYAIWHSSLVRSQLTTDDVDFTVLAATSVLSDLVEKCPPAEACRDSFMRMSKVTISMVLNTTGFGTTSTLATQALNTTVPGSLAAHRPQSSVSRPAGKRPAPQFDMNLKDLFSDEEIAGRPLVHHQAAYSPDLTSLQHHASDAQHQYHNDPAPADSDQPPFSPFAEPYNLDYLHTATDFPDAGSTTIWDPAHAAAHAPSDLVDFSFDGSGAWEANGELFDAFFFGPSGTQQQQQQQQQPPPF